MKHLWGIILFALAVNGVFCDELFVISDYYTIDSDKKIIRFINHQYNKGESVYTYVLSLYEDDDIGIDMAYRTGHIYIVAYYKNPGRFIYEYSDELFKQFSYQIKFIEPIENYNKIINKDGRIVIRKETSDIFRGFLMDMELIPTILKEEEVI
jgi:hypothetical protein